jgi:carboxylesterase
MRPLAHAFAEAGFTVEQPLLPGHGTKIDDMLETHWADWSSAAEAAYVELASRCGKVAVAGLSMGGTITVWLAERHPEIAGIVTVNPMIDPPAESFRDVLRQMAEHAPVMQGIGSNIADPSVKEFSYDGTPIEQLLSLIEAVDEVHANLASVRCPVLIFTSPKDGVVPPVSSDVLAAGVSGPVERVFCERSLHVATLDYDHEEIEARAVEFVGRL